MERDGMTPHIEAKEGTIASTVIMPGDPMRAKFIAEQYLENYELVNDVRGMLAYTGYYKGKRVTVMGSGMGMPSIGIYSYELFQFYQVENIIRVGSCGSYDPNLHVFDVILVEEAYSTSSYAKVQNGSMEDIIKADTNLNQKIIETSERLGMILHPGRIYSSDVFYTKDSVYEKMYHEKNCLGVEMESFALFHNAKVLGKHAACVLTVSDSFITKEETTSEEREVSFTNMIELVLETLV